MAIEDRECPVCRDMKKMIKEREEAMERMKQGWRDFGAVYRQKLKEEFKPACLSVFLFACLMSASYFFL